MLPSPPRGSSAHEARGAGAGMGPLALVVASGKGGVGTSTIAALAALAAADRGQRVLLVDATESGGGGTLHHLFGVRPTTSVWSLADPQTRVDDALLDLGGNLTLVAGATAATGAAPTSDTARRTAVQRLARVHSRYDFVVFDGGSRLDTLTALTDVAEPALLLVTSADRLALAANYALVKAVSARHPNAIMSVLANRHGEALAEEACEYLVGACAHFLGRTLDVLGAVPDDPCLQAGVGAGMTVRDALDGSPAADAVRDVVSRLTPSWPAAPRPAAAAVSSSLTPSRRWS